MEFSYVDYRRDDCIHVEKLDDTTMHIKLDFFIRTEEDDHVLSLWTAKWDLEDVISCFEDGYDIIKGSEFWAYGESIEFDIRVSPETTPEDVFRKLRYTSLEDAEYEATEETFWTIPQEFIDFVKTDTLED